MSQIKLLNKHPLSIRIFHWINFFILAMMIWSGLLIYWANDVYKLGWGDFTLFHFFPDSFYKALNLHHKLAKGMSFHFSFMWLFMLNGLGYIIFLFITRQIKDIIPQKRSFKEAWLVVLHDLHIKRGLPHQQKYNSAQRLAYSFVIIMGLFIVLTGFAIYKPVQLYWLCWLMGGYATARALHFTLAVLFCLFFLVHIIQVILAGWNNFKAMVTGIEQKNRKRTVPSFAIFAIYILLCIGSVHWIFNQPKENGAYRPLRKTMDLNEKIFSSIFSDNNLSRDYPVDKAAKIVRRNGYIGLKSKIDTSNWKLQVLINENDTIYVTLDEIKSLPKTDVVFDFKCVEGWNQITHWAGVTFADFMEAYHLENQKNMKYTGFYSTDQKYYVGIDIKSMLHPQTILCYEINGKPLPLDQGAPLRLIIPVKYGVKHIKRIGTIYFSNERPRDYWYERGYDYYCGL